MKAEEILTSSLDDLVFERKNKAYGAYFLRQTYIKHITMALVVALIIFLLGFSAPTIASFFVKFVPPPAKPKILNTTLAPPPPIEPNTPPPPPPPKLPPPPKQVALTPPVIKEDKDVKQDETPPPAPPPVAPPATPGAFDPNAKEDFSSAPAVVEAPAKPQIFTFVQQMPAYPGGDKALFKYLQDNIKYPTAARENQIEGTVLLEFVVNEDGSITDVKALRDISGGCTEEAIRVVKSMPKWKPGVQNGASVKVQYHLPVTFKLNTE